MLDESRDSHCSVLKLDLAVAKSSVRVDSSASRGYAHEQVVVGRLLFSKFEKLAVGDRVDLMGVSLKVASCMPRISVTGDLDHYQVDVTIWASDG